MEMCQFQFYVQITVQIKIFLINLYFSKFLTEPLGSAEHQSGNTDLD
jgi:hypothetical protein